MNADQVKELIIKGIPGSTVEVADTKKVAITLAQ